MGEEFFESGKRFFSAEFRRIVSGLVATSKGDYVPSSNDLGVLFSKLLLHRGRNTFVDLGGAERLTDGEESVHSIGSLVDLATTKVSKERNEEVGGLYLIELRSSLEVLESQNEEEDMREGSNGVGVSTEHEVGESDVVVDGDVSPGDSSEESLLVEVDAFEHSERERVVSEENVHSKETENREVSELRVKRHSAVFSTSEPVRSHISPHTVQRVVVATHSTSSPFCAATS